MLTPEERERRRDVLRKHGTKDSPEPLTALQIADKLGINVGTWNVWKSNRKKKGARVRTASRRGRPTEERRVT